ncbi:hypothetical protein HBH71_212620 [Parastagonospora nodorum]|nr:hypothetical protein HBH71_212620 [Parastagonospora nodorum]
MEWACINDEILESYIQFTQSTFQRDVLEVTGLMQKGSCTGNVVVSLPQSDNLAARTGKEGTKSI